MTVKFVDDVKVAKVLAEIQLNERQRIIDILMKQHSIEAKLAEDCRNSELFWHKEVEIKEARLAAIAEAIKIVKGFNDVGESIESTTEPATTGEGESGVSIGWSSVPFL